MTNILIHIFSELKFFNKLFEARFSYKFKKRLATISNTGSASKWIEKITIMSFFD